MKSLLKICLLSLAIGAAPQALAGKFELRNLLGQVAGVEIADSHHRRDLKIAQNNGPTLSEAIEMVKRQYDGRIVGARTVVSGGREVHHIKVLTEDGTVITVKIPGRSTQS